MGPATILNAILRSIPNKKIVVYSFNIDEHVNKFDVFLSTNFCDEYLPGNNLPSRAPVQLHLVSLKTLSPAILETPQPDEPDHKSEVVERKYATFNTHIITKTSFSKNVFKLTILLET